MMCTYVQGCFDSLVLGIAGGKKRGRIEASVDTHDVPRAHTILIRANIHNTPAYAHTWYNTTLTYTHDDDTLIIRACAHTTHMTGRRQLRACTDDTRIQPIIRAYNP